MLIHIASFVAQMCDLYGLMEMTLIASFLFAHSTYELLSYILPLILFHPYKPNLRDAPLQTGNCCGYMSYRCKFYRQFLVSWEPSSTLFRSKNWNFAMGPIGFYPRDTMLLWVYAMAFPSVSLCVTLALYQNG